MSIHVAYAGCGKVEKRPPVIIHSTTFGEIKTICWFRWPQRTACVCLHIIYFAARWRYCWSIGTNHKHTTRSIENTGKGKLRIKGERARERKRARTHNFVYFFCVFIFRLKSVSSQCQRNTPISIHKVIHICFWLKTKRLLSRQNIKIHQSIYLFVPEKNVFNFSRWRRLRAFAGRVLTIKICCSSI